MNLSAVLRTRRPATPNLVGLQRVMATATVLGAVLCLFLPVYSYWFGWTPLWLVLMPAAAWWALHRFRMPAPVTALVSRRRRVPVQARRRRKSLNPRVFVRVA